QRSQRAGGRVDGVTEDVRARRDIQVGAGLIRGDVMAHRNWKWRTAEGRQCPAGRVDTEARYARVRGVGICRVEKLASLREPERQTERVAASGKRRSGHWGQVVTKCRNVVRAAVVRYEDNAIFGVNNNRRRALARGNPGP